jgi:hypothetical protein
VLFACLTLVAIGALAMTVWVGVDRGDASQTDALSGSVIIDDAHVFFDRPCNGLGVDRDLHRGTPVVVRDANGRELATTVLQTGVRVGYHACVFAFVVEHMHPSTTLAVQVGNRNNLVLGTNEHRGNDWTIELQAQGTRIANYF